MKYELAGFGSAVLLDYFYLINPSAIRLSQRYINSSFPSQFSSRIVSIEKDMENTLLTSQKNILLKDFNKDFIKNCINKRVDYILIDFINERLPLIKLDDGALLTYSNELKLSNYLSNKDFKIIEPYSKEYFEIWAACWDGFIKRTKALGLLDKVVINKVFWAKATESGQPFPLVYSQSEIYESNVYLYQLYAYCSKDIPKKNFIEYYPEDFLANDKHRWGVTPYHYTDNFYRKMSLGLKVKLNLI